MLLSRQRGFFSISDSDLFWRLHGLAVWLMNPKRLS